MSNYYRQRFDGEWVDVTKGRIGACCDCGLCHQEEYLLVGKEADIKNKDICILRRAFRLNRDTADRRRSMKAKKEGLYRLFKKPSPKD